jgi:MoaA/NifB/PqqE/SkfB family radical SAM enzyme
MTATDVADLEAKLYPRAYDQRVPLRVALELTAGCNLDCVHCLHPRHEAVDELTTDEVCAVLDGLAELGTLFLVVTGGEPLTRSDLPQVLSHARGLGLITTLLTNATLVDERLLARLCAAAPEVVVGVSLYGATAPTYEAVTRRPGAFAAFQRGVELLRETGLSLGLTAVVLRDNVHELRAMQALSEQWGVKFRYATDVHARLDGSLAPLAHRLPPTQVLELERSVTAERDGPCGIAAPLSGPFYCPCGRAGAAVTARGELNFCVSVPLPRLDLRRTTLGQAWAEAVRARDRMDAVRAACAGCELYALCRRGAHDSLLELGDLSQCVPYYRELALLESAER